MPDEEQPGTAGAEKPVACFKPENLLVLCRVVTIPFFFLSSQGPYVAYSFLKFKKDEECLVVDLEKGAYCAKGLDREFKIGEGCHESQKEFWGILGVFDRTDDAHINAMLTAATAAGQAAIYSACRRIRP